MDDELIREMAEVEARVQAESSSPSWVARLVAGLLFLYILLFAAALVTGTLAVLILAVGTIREMIF